MRIGIFGGSFNPPHKMHLKIAEYLLDNDYLDKVIIVPTGSQYKYKNNLISDKHRYEMLKIMVKNDNRITVSDYELKDYVVYTCETLAHFKEEYPNDQIHFICGTDNLSYIDKWKNGLEILTNYKIIVIDRSTNKVDELLEQFKEYKENIVVAPLEMEEVSSTIVRELIQNKEYEKAGELIDKEVMDYIIKENLYESEQN